MFSNRCDFCYESREIPACDPSPSPPFIYPQLRPKYLCVLVFDCLVAPLLDSCWGSTEVASTNVVALSMLISPLVLPAFIPISIICIIHAVLSLPMSPSTSHTSFALLLYIRFRPHHQYPSPHYHPPSTRTLRRDTCTILSLPLIIFSGAGASDLFLPTLLDITSGCIDR